MLQKDWREKRGTFLPLRIKLLNNKNNFGKSISSENKGPHGKNLK